MTRRIARFKAQLATADLDGYLVTHLPHVRYLCGFSGSNGLLLIAPGGAEFYTDSRYAEQVRTEVKGARKVVPADGNLLAALARSRLIRGRHPRLGIQGRYLTVTAQQTLAQALPTALLVPHDDLVEPLTVIKDAGEIAHIRRAVEIVDRAFAEILPRLRPGRRELEVAAELEFIMLRLGSEGTAFETICASGKRSALPHGKASKKRIAEGDFITFDFGATVHGYCSDITRTVVLGRASTRQRRIYDTVRRAQAAAVRRVKPGASTRAVDEAARNIIRKAGHAKRFGHGTGHGLGLEVHQPPSLSTRTDSTLRPGMIVTVEPGIYIPGFGGVRIEDDVLVTRRGHEVLTQSPKRLIEV